MNKMSQQFQGSLGSTPRQSLASSLSCEEGNIIDYDLFVQKETGSIHDLPRTKEYYFQDYPYSKPTQAEFDRREIDKSELFTKKKVLKKQESAIEDDGPGREASILVTGFGMRNVDSFQRLIKMSHEERMKWELKKLWRDAQGKSQLEDHRKGDKYKETVEGTELSISTSTDLVTQTDVSYKTDVERGTDDQLKRLDYLMGLEAATEEFEEEPAVETEETVDDFKYSTSKPVRDAQRYLRVHRIFECFQFIVAHMLSAKAENPIEFMLSLLNQCLLYRSGLGEPPLLYDKIHINKLFDLMDRFQTGFVELQQFETGLKTLGICSYNGDPEVNDKGMVSREVFVEEIYDAELAVFDDMIKKRAEKSRVKPKKSPSAFDSISVPSLNPPYFIPSDLFKISHHSIGSSTISGG